MYCRRSGGQVELRYLWILARAPGDEPNFTLGSVHMMRGRFAHDFAQVHMSTSKPLVYQNQWFAFRGFRSDNFRIELPLHHIGPQMEANSLEHKVEPEVGRRPERGKDQEWLSGMM